MRMSISGLLDISSTAIASQKIAMEVTGTNIANVNTPGYSRQRAVFDAAGNVALSANEVLAGVEVSNIERLYDRYLEKQIVDRQQNTGYGEVREDILGQVEGIINDSAAGGLQDILSRFWNSWEDLASDPTSQVAREGVISLGDNLASRFREAGRGLAGVRQNIQEGIADKIEDVNALAREIGVLNEQVLAAGDGGGRINGLLDRRTEQLKELSKNINISYYENADGTLDVFLANGMSLLEGGIVRELTTMDGNIVLRNSPSAALDDYITGGALGGLLELRDITVKGYSDALDQLAFGIINAVNAGHQAGYNAAGNQPDPAANEYFFQPVTAAADAAQNMSISAYVAADSSRIAASAAAGGGDGENARLIGSLKDSLILGGGSVTVGDYYASLVGRVGFDLAAANRNAGHNALVLSSLAAQREAASGVSLDEEMINLIKYQAGYNAAGRLMKVANEMLDLLMQLGS